MIDVFHLLCQLVHRIKLPSLEDDTGDTTMHSTTMARPSVDIPSTYDTYELGKEKFVEGSYTNGLYVNQNGGSVRSNSLTPPLPAAQPVDDKDKPAKPLED